MPMIVSAIVLRWDYEGCYVSETPVNMYVGDAADDALKVLIIGKYILDQAKDHDDKIRELIEDARDGLLQVTKIEKQDVAPPPMPLFQDRDEQARSRQRGRRKAKEEARGRRKGRNRKPMEGEGAEEESAS